MTLDAHNRFPPLVALLSTNPVVMQLVQKRNLLVAESNVVWNWLHYARERAMRGIAAKEAMEAKVRYLTDSSQRVTPTISSLEKLGDALEYTRERMQNAGGLSIWPKSMLHPPLPKDDFGNYPYFSLEPCGFSQRGFHFFDVCLTSCKHSFHSWYLAKVCRTSNKCSVCNELFHPD